MFTNGKPKLIKIVKNKNNLKTYNLTSNPILYKFLMFRSVIQLIRVKDWIKNIVIFFPIIFSSNFYSLENIINVLVAFLYFLLQLPQFIYLMIF